MPTPSGTNTPTHLDYPTVFRQNSTATLSAVLAVAATACPPAQRITTRQPPLAPTRAQYVIAPENSVKSTDLAAFYQLQKAIEAAARQARKVEDMAKIRSGFDEELPPPTAYSLSEARSILFGVARDGIAIPPMTPSTLGDSGLVMLFRRGNKRLSVGIPAAAGGRAYVYRQNADAYDVDEGLSVDSLARWLRWLNER